jgi:hypothetical protein
MVESVSTITEYHCGVILPAPKFFVLRSNLDEECCMIAQVLRHTRATREHHAPQDRLRQ